MCKFSLVRVIDEKNFNGENFPIYGTQKTAKYDVINLNIFTNTYTPVDLLVVSAIAFGLPQATHLLSSFLFLIMHTSHSQDPVSGVNSSVIAVAEVV